MNDELKAKFYNSSPLSFFRDILPSRSFPKYIAHVQRIAAMFCVTYILLQTALLRNEVHEVSPLLPALGSPSQWNSSVVELIHRAGN